MSTVTEPPTPETFAKQANTLRRKLLEYDDYTQGKVMNIAFLVADTADSSYQPIIQAILDETQPDVREEQQPRYEFLKRVVPQYPEFSKLVANSYYEAIVMFRARPYE